MAKFHRNANYPELVRWIMKSIKFLFTQDSVFTEESIWVDTAPFDPTAETSRWTSAV